MTERITSRQNRLLIHLSHLQSSRAYREQTREFCGEGTKLLEEAVRWFPGLHTVIARDDLPLPPLGESIRIVRVPDHLMKSLSTMRTPQGVIFLCHMPAPLPFSMTPGSLILDCIQDPGNLGTILRTADAMKVPVVLCNGCADPYGEKTVRASMGAVLRTRPIQAENVKILAYCAENGIPIAAADLGGKPTDIRNMELSRFAVVIGSEGQGVSKHFLDCAEQRMIIPMDDRCESLNAAVAATIVLWEMRRNR